MHIHRKQNVFTFADGCVGMFIVLASKGTTRNEMMSSYDVRGWVEKAFDVYKNDLDGSLSRTGDPDRARGAFFIKFVALMMRMHMMKRSDVTMRPFSPEKQKGIRPTERRWTRYS